MDVKASDKEISAGGDEKPKLSPKKKAKKIAPSLSPAKGSMASLPSTVPATTDELLALGLTPPIPQKLALVSEELIEIVKGRSVEELMHEFDCDESEAKEVLELVKQATLHAFGPPANDTQSTNWFRP